VSESSASALARKPSQISQGASANGGGELRSVPVIDVLGARSGVPSNLVVETRSQGKQGVTNPRWQARWILPSSFLPPLKPGEKRHQHTRRTTGLEATEENLKEACRIAKRLYEEELRIAAQTPTGTINKRKALLEIYWEKYISDLEVKVRSGKKSIKNPNKYLNDKKTLWQKKDGTGVGDQLFAKKDIREIGTRDGDRYQELLQDKGFSAKHIANHKTLLTELVELAAKDYPEIPRVIYSKLKDAPRGNPKEEYFFTGIEWEKFCAAIAKESQDYARKDLSHAEYLALPFGWQRENVRNWVDFYHLCRLMECCHLRTQDLSEIKGSDFKINDDGKGGEVLTITVREPKRNAPSHPIHCMSDDAVRLWKRIRQRMKSDKEYVLFNHIEDDQRRENKCKFNTLKTHLLEAALEKAELPRTNAYGKNANITSMRHTGFMIDLANQKSRGMIKDSTDLMRFAENGLTSKKMIEEVYLSHIDRFEFSAEAVRRSKESPNEMLLVRRASNTFT
jgi:hypothetical protein